MYTKEELESMDIPQLVGIADQLGIKVNPDDQMEDVVYAILDKAAENSAVDDSPKKKRTRIAKKDTSKVYTVNGNDGENLDSKSNRKPKNQATPSLFSDLPVQTAEAPAEEEPAPKRRGRKSKAEKEAEEAAAAAAAEAEAQQVAEESDNFSDIVPEAANFDSNPNDEPAVNALEQLRAKMTTHKDPNPAIDTDEVDENGVWMGDPDDGTDFITVLDIPIEDQAATPTLDIFDRPMVQQAPANDPVMPSRPQSQPKYDFTDIISGNGVLECLTDGYGFLRSSDYNYLSSPDDIYISPQQIKKYGLKTGDVVECSVRPPHENEKYFAMTSVKSINGREPSEVRDRVAFEHLTPLFPEEKFTLCGDKATTNPSVRIVDLFSPIARVSVH